MWPDGPYPKVSLWEDSGRLGELRASWDKLLAGVPTASVFSSWEWLLPWWRAFGAGQQLRVLAFFDQAANLIGLAPLSLATRSFRSGLRLRVLRLLGDGSEDSDNLDFLIQPGHEVGVAGALLDWIETHSRIWDVCEFATVPESSPAAAAVLNQLNIRRLCVRTCRRPWSAVPLPGTWDAYLSQLSAEDRHNLPRYLRRLQKRYRVRFCKCTQESELDSALQILYGLHQSRWNQKGEPGTFACENRRHFYREMAGGLLARERLEFWLLYLDDKPVAAQFAVRYGNTVFQLQEGFDPQHYSDRVGYLLRAHVLKQLIAEGVCRYDFLGGKTPHKSRWGSETGSYVTIRFAKRPSLGSLYVRCVHHSGEIKEWLRGQLPEPAWAALHRLRLNCGGTRNESTPALEEPERLERSVEISA
jgi:CelD/BcsL family acetyltransferase involved in cellulose biosynthesis